MNGLDGIGIQKAVIVASSESPKITRLVYYSLAISPAGSRETQWIQSIRSLRRYNAHIPVQLFLFNGAPPAMIREAHRQRVEVFELGDYVQYLDRLFVHGSLLAQYPTFHKFLVLTHSPARAANQILYLDCDTFFFHDVETLFNCYESFDWCAREEPTSRLSYLPRDPAHLDEAVLDGLRPVMNIRDSGKPGAFELRLVAGPLGNAGAAARLCAMLSAAGLTCQPAVFDGQRLALK